MQLGMMWGQGHRLMSMSGLQHIYIPGRVSSANGKEHLLTLSRWSRVEDHKLFAELACKTTTPEPAVDCLLPFHFVSAGSLARYIAVLAMKAPNFRELYRRTGEGICI